MGRGEGGRSPQVCRVQILKEKEPFVSVAAADEKKRKKKKKSGCVVCVQSAC